MLQPTNKIYASANIHTQQHKDRVVVFDLDETLGHFHLIRLVWESINNFIGFNKIPYMMGQSDFNNLFDIFPEMLRPDILSILQVLKKRRDDKICNGVMVYTNNKYPKEWVYLIINYIEEKLGGKIFDNIVLAFKLNGRVQELGRTEKAKKLSDFVACCRLPSDVEICYFDDTAFPGMMADSVYYLKVRSYCYPYTEREIIKRITVPPFLSHILCTTKPQHIAVFLQHLSRILYMKKYTFGEKSFMEYEVDKVISKRIMTHLNTFFRDNVSIPMRIK